MYCAIRPDYGRSGSGRALLMRCLGGGRDRRGPGVVGGLPGHGGRRRAVVLRQLPQRAAQLGDVAREVRADAARLNLVALPTAAVGDVVLAEPKPAVHDDGVAL